MLQWRLAGINANGIAMISRNLAGLPFDAPRRFLCGTQAVGETTRQSTEVLFNLLATFTAETFFKK